MLGRLALWGGGRNSALIIWNARQPEDPGADRIAPHHRFSSLVLQHLQDIAVTLCIDVTLKRLPLRNEVAGTICAVVMRIVDVLNDSFSRMQNVGIGHVVEK